MKIITDEKCSGYFCAGHPERPTRVTATVERLKNQSELPLTWAAPGTVNDEQILRAPVPEMLERLKIPREFDADTPFFEDIADYARASAAAALEALATGTKRVAVFDFDVHHGNGTENILLNHEGAAFFSIHQFPAYPGTGDRNIGKNCFNYPVAPSAPRETYRATLGRALADLKNFAPDLIGVSAGFDAYARDPLADGTLQIEDFHWLGQELRALNIPFFSLLEGGYSKDLPELIFAYLKGVEGK